MSRYVPPTFGCRLCPPGLDGEDVQHPVTTKRWYDHRRLTDAILRGDLEQAWWTMTKSQRHRFISRVEKLAGEPYSPLHQAVERDGPSRSAAHRYFITGNASLIDMLLGRTMGDIVAALEARYGE